MNATATIFGCNASEDSHDFVARLGLPTPLAIDHDAPAVHITYAVEVERDIDFKASIPAFPGCVAVADTEEELAGLIDEALQMHIDGMIAV